MDKKAAVLLVWLFSLSSSEGVLVEICDICDCLQNGNILNIECKNSALKEGAKFDLKNLQWPMNSDKNYSIKAFFNDLNITYLPQLNGNPNVVALNFGNNHIESVANEPFANFPNLSCLTISNNRLSVFERDFFKVINKLRHIDLSNNSMTNVDALTFSKFKLLEAIDLSYNKLSTISSELMNALANVSKLNFEGSQIYAMGNTNASVSYKWKVLNLSRNKLSVVTTSTFEAFPEIEVLYLSRNSITVIDKDSFLKLASLKLLDLSHNQLQDFSLMLQLPNQLEMVTFENNKLKLWPFHHLPGSLLKLEMQRNELVELFSSEQTFTNLRYLNISDNKIENMPGDSFPALETLDLSYNQFTSVPPNLGHRAPRLNELVLDNNPIENIRFADKIQLGRLSMSNMPLLKSLDANTFSNVVGIKERSYGEGNCVEIKVANCPHLENVHEQAFENTKLCKLDLSYNQLTSLPQNLTAWKDIESGIDLQGNPFVCGCSLQWMLDTVMVHLYRRLTLQYLLTELKCAAPEHFANQRFVKFYRKPKAFCRTSENMRMENNVLAAGMNLKPHDEGLKLNKGPGLVIIISLSALVLISMITVGVYLTLDQNKRMLRRRNNRRFDK